MHFGAFLPFFRVNTPDSPSSYTSSAFIAGIAVGVVVMPTVTSIMREVFSQAPIGEREGAIALGRDAVGDDPHRRDPVRARPASSAAIMLGLGRALGETIVVYAIISPMFEFTTHPLQSGTNTIASHIASRYSESSGIALSGLLGAGLVLFLFTLVINTARRHRGQPVALRRSDGDLNDHAHSSHAVRGPAGPTRGRRASRARRACASAASAPSSSRMWSARRCGALALVWLVYERLLPMTGAIGFWLSWYALFLVLLAAISSTTLDRVAVTDRLVGAAGDARPG